MTASSLEFAHLVELREAIRAFLLVRSNPSPGEAAATLGAVAGPLSVQLTGAPDPTLTSTGGAIDELQVELVLALVVSSATGSLRRLKTCGNPGCRWVFFDHSRNRSGRWCSMQACGGRDKARRYRRRSG